MLARVERGARQELRSGHERILVPQLQLARRTAASSLKNTGGRAAAMTASAALAALHFGAKTHEPRLLVERHRKQRGGRPNRSSIKRREAAGSPRRDRRRTPHGSRSSVAEAGDIAADRFDVGKLDALSMPWQ